jgi:hypothetical protein
MSSTSSITSAKHVLQRVEAVDWNHISQDLDSHGNAIIENLISSNDCDALVNLYSEYGIFRSRVVMDLDKESTNTLAIRYQTSLIVLGLPSIHI